MPKLDLSNTPVLGDLDMGQFKRADEILDDVKSDAETLGLVQYPRPNTAPISLADIDITTLANNNLGQLYVQYTAHAQYVFGELTLAEVAYRVVSGNLKLVEAKLKAKFFSMETAKAEIPARVREDPLRIEYELEVLKLYAMKEVLGAHYKAYDKQAQALSRIIALRELEFNQQMRENGIGNIRKGRPGRPDRDFNRPAGG